MAIARFEARLHCFATSSTAIHAWRQKPDFPQECRLILGKVDCYGQPGKMAKNEMSPVPYALEEVLPAIAVLTAVRSYKETEIEPGPFCSRPFCSLLLA